MVEYEDNMDANKVALVGHSTQDMYPSTQHIFINYSKATD